MKFFLNLSIFGPVMQHPDVEKAFGWMKPGFYNYKELWRLMVYMMPEIFIACLLMVNEIQLRMLGLYYSREDDIENITDGIQRSLQQGDIEAVRQNKIEKANMKYAINYESMGDQKHELAEMKRMYESSELERVRVEKE